MEVAPQAGTEYAWNNYHEIAENTRLDVPRILNMSFIDCTFLPSGRLPTAAQVSTQIPTAILWVCLSMYSVSHFLRWTHQFKNYPPVSIKRGNATSPIHKRMMVPMEPYPFPSHPATIDGGQPWSHGLPILPYVSILVGGIPTPLKNINQLGWWHSQYMESHKSHVPNHQPAYVPFTFACLICHETIKTASPAINFSVRPALLRLRRYRDSGKQTESACGLSRFFHPRNTRLNDQSMADDSLDDVRCWTKLVISGQPCVKCRSCTPTTIQLWLPQCCMVIADGGSFPSSSSDGGSPVSWSHDGS